MTAVTAPAQTRRAVAIEPLADGDTETVAFVFHQLSPQTRRWRFGAAKPRLSAADLELLARVDSERLVLVARAGEHPIGLAHLVRFADSEAAEVAIVVADRWQRRGVGIALARRLACEAAAAGIAHVRALIAADNRASLALMRTATTVIRSRFEGSDLDVVGRIPIPSGRRGTTAVSPAEGGPTVTTALHRRGLWPSTRTLEALSASVIQPEPPVERASQSRQPRYRTETP